MSRPSAMTSYLLGLLVLLLLLSRPAFPSPVTVLPCKTILQDLVPCLKFIKGSEQKPSKNCCSGLKTVVGSVKSKTDRQNVCECVKVALSGSKYDPAKVPGLSKKCGVSVVLPPISAKTNCANAFFN